MKFSAVLLPVLAVAPVAWANQEPASPNLRGKEDRELYPYNDGYCCADLSHKPCVHNNDHSCVPLTHQGLCPAGTTACPSVPQGCCELYYGGHYGALCEHDNDGTCVDPDRYGHCPAGSHKCSGAPPSTTTTTTSTTTTKTPPGGCFYCDYYKDPFDPCKNDPTTGGSFFPHCDPYKYIHCGAGPTCHEQPCAPGTVWSQNYKTCVHAS